jgi:hypothetical protein
MRILSDQNLHPGTVQKLAVKILTAGSYVQLSVVNLFNIIISRVETELRIFVCVCGRMRVSVSS